MSQRLLPCRLEGSHDTRRFSESDRTAQKFLTDRHAQKPCNFASAGCPTRGHDAYPHRLMEPCVHIFPPAFLICRPTVPVIHYRDHISFDALRVLSHRSSSLEWDFDAPDSPENIVYVEGRLESISLPKLLRKLTTRSQVLGASRFSLSFFSQKLLFI